MGSNHKFRGSFGIFSKATCYSIHNDFSFNTFSAFILGFVLLSTFPFVDLVYADSIIVVGNSPIDLIYVESLDLIFVTNQASHDLTVIQASTETIIGTISVGTSPIQPLFVETTGLLYVSNQGSNDVTVIDGMTDVPINPTIIATIPVGIAPFEMDFNPNNNQIYVANSFSNSVSVIDADDTSPNFNTVVDSIPGEIAPIGLIVNPITNLIYFTNLFSNSVTVVDGDTDTVVDTILVSSAGGISIDLPNNNIIVSNPFSGSISIIDGNDASPTFNTVIQVIPVGNGPRSAAVNPITNLIFVPNNDDGTLSIIDAITFNAIGAIPVGLTPFGVDVNSVDNLIYIANQNENSIRIVNIGANFPPNANAGPDKTIEENAFVQLDGSASNDFDGDPLTFQWTQTKGPVVILSDSNSPTPSFIAPEVAIATLLQFQLIVNDGTFDSLPDFVNVIVKDTTIFTVQLNPVGGELKGDLTIENFPANNPVTFDFITPSAEIVNGALDETELTSVIAGTDVEFDFTVDSEVPMALPPLVDPALFFEIDFDGIDFSNPSNLPPDNLPQFQFLISKDYQTDQEFSDGCPVVPLFLLNENTNEWEQQGNPLLPNSNKIHVTDSINGEIIIIDGNTNQVESKIDVGTDPHETIFDPDKNKIYTASLGSGVVTVINALDNSIITTIPGLPGVSPVNIDPSENELFVATFGPGLVYVIDTNTDTVVDTIVSGGTGLSNLRINPTLHKAYLTDITVNQLIVIDTISNTVIDTVPLPGIAGGVSINQKNNLVYISLFSTNSVIVVDGETHAILETIPVGASPVGVGVNSNTNKIFVANAGSGTVSVIDGAVNAVIETIPLAISILGLDVNENTDRVYVVNQAFGTLSIIDGTKLEVLDSIFLQQGLFTVAFNDQVPNPVRDPASDDGNFCAYQGEGPHLSRFAIGGIKALALGALAGGSGSTGGHAPTMKSISFDGISNSNDEGVLEFGGLVIDKITPVNNFPTQKVKTGTPFELRLPFYEDNGVGSLQHVAVYFLQGDEKTIYDSQTSIIYEPNSSVEFSDTAGLISNVSAKGIVKSAYDVDVIFGMTFNFPTDEPIDVLVRSWDKHRRSSDIKFNDLILVEFNSPFNLPLDTSLDDTQEWSKSVQSSLTKSTTIFKEDFDGSFITIDTENGQSVTKHTAIPLWIKNNAHWWSQDEIDNDDFVASVQYLIEKDVLSVPKRHVISILETAPPTEIPNWIKSNAKWWASDSISDEEFVQSIQWLIEKGIMTV